MRASGFTSSNVGVAFDNYAVFWFQTIFFLNLTVIASKKIVPDVKCPPGVLGCQMPPGDIGASNANRGYWGVKCHPRVIGESKAWGSQKAGASKGMIT